MRYGKSKYCLPKHQNGDPVNSNDAWIRKIMEFESRQGSANGTGLSNWGYNSRQPKSIDEAINYFKQDYLPKVEQYPMGMRERAGDFMYNSGEDPRVYMLDQYVRKYKNMPNGIPNRQNFRKMANSNDFNNLYSQYSKDIDALPLEDRTSLLDQGKDFYYSNINQVDGKPNPAYNTTWAPRVKMWGQPDITQVKSNVFTPQQTKTVTSNPFTNYAPKSINKAQYNSFTASPTVSPVTAVTNNSSISPSANTWATIGLDGKPLGPAEVPFPTPTTSPVLANAGYTPTTDGGNLNNGRVPTPPTEQTQQQQKPQVGGVPIWNHLLMAGNVIGRQLAENASRNRRGNYYQNNAANPYSGILGYNDGQSDGAKYGTVGYQKGGQLPSYQGAGETCPPGYYKHSVLGCIPNPTTPQGKDKQQAQIKTSNRVVKGNGKKIDPYVNIIDKDTKAIETQRRKDVLGRAAISAGVAGAIVTGGALAPYVAPAMSAPIAGVQGLTTANLVNAGFAYHGAKNIPKALNTVKTAYNNPNASNILDATAETAITALDMLPFGSGISKGVRATIPNLLKFGTKTPKLPKNGKVETTLVESVDPDTGKSFFVEKPVERLTLKPKEDVPNFSEQFRNNAIEREADVLFGMSPSNALPPSPRFKPQLGVYYTQEELAKEMANVVPFTQRLPGVLYHRARKPLSEETFNLFQRMRANGKDMEPVLAPKRGDYNLATNGGDYARYLELTNNSAHNVQAANIDLTRYHLSTQRAGIQPATDFRRAALDWADNGYNNPSFAGTVGQTNIPSRPPSWQDVTQQIQARQNNTYNTYVIPTRDPRATNWNSSTGQWEVPSIGQRFIKNAKWLGKEIERGINQGVDKVDTELGKLISPAVEMPKFDPIKLQESINSQLQKGLGINKTKFPLRAEIVSDGQRKLNVKTFVGDVRTGTIELSQNMNHYNARKLSDLISSNWNTAKGFKKKGDFPFNDYQGNLYDLDNPSKVVTREDFFRSGISGEYNAAINNVLKDNKLGNVISGGTGHTDLGKARWENLVKKGKAEKIPTRPGTQSSYEYRLLEEGGEVEAEEEVDYDNEDLKDYEFMFEDEEKPSAPDSSAYQSLYDEGMPNIDDYTDNKDAFAKDLEEWRIEYLSGKESADEDDERHQRSKALLEEFINKRENINAPITFDEKGKASNVGTLEESISSRESGGNYKAYTSAGGGEGAVGKYQFRWTTHKDWIRQVTGVSSKEEFMNNPEAQEKAFQYWKKTNLEPTAKSLYDVAQTTFPGITLNEMMRKIHFLGEGGARKYFRTGKSDVKDAFGTTAGSYEAGGLVSKLGYRSYSPFVNEPSLDIYTEDGSIDMSETPFDVKATQGNTEVIMKANTKSPYQFKPGVVHEERMQFGGLLQPNSWKLPSGVAIPNRPDMLSTELATSIGGENGEPAYLIPSFKYGKRVNPLSEYRKTGDYLGGPFKTWQEADVWEKNIRHPYVEKGQSIPSPLKTWGEKVYQKAGEVLPDLLNGRKLASTLRPAANSTFVPRPVNIRVVEEATREADLKKGITYTNQQAVEARNFHTKWLDSPMYNKMIKESVIGNHAEFTNNRKKNLKNVDFNYINNQLFDNRTAGFSTRETGDITILPLAVRKKDPDMGVHELSHSSDRPTVEDGARVIPYLDVKRLDYFNSLNKNKIDKPADWIEYVTEPTEVRARLNGIRNKGYKEKAYDPFKESVNPTIYKKLLKGIDKNNELDPLKQLRGVYTDDQIIHLLNSMSKNENNNGLIQAQKGGSVVDALNAQGKDSSKEARTKLAKELGIENYDYSAAKNIELLNKLPKGSSSSQSTKDYGRNISFSKAFKQASGSGAEEFVWNGKRYNTEVAPEGAVRSSRVPTQVSPKAPVQSAPKAPAPVIAPIPTQPVGTFAVPKLLQKPAPAGTVFRPGYGIGNGANVPVQPPANGRTPGYDPKVSRKPLDMERFKPNMAIPAGSVSKKPAAPLNMDKFKPNTTGTPVARPRKPIVKSPWEKDKEKIEDLVTLGKNGIARMYQKYFGDDSKAVSTMPTGKKAPVKNPDVITLEDLPKQDTIPQAPQPIEPFVPPIITGDTIWDSDRAYHIPEKIDLLRVKMGARNRGDNKPVESDGLIFSAFDKQRILNNKQINDNNTYVGVDDEGNIRAGVGSSFKDKNYKLLQFNSKKITNFAKNDKGDYIKQDASGAAPNHSAPMFNGPNGMANSNLLIKNWNYQSQKTYGNITGGKALFTSPDYSKQIVLSGSVETIDQQLEEWKKENGLTEINYMMLDNGSYARGYRTKDGKMNFNDWRAADLRNSDGNSGFYLKGKGYQKGGTLVSQVPAGYSPVPNKPNYYSKTTEASVQGTMQPQASNANWAAFLASPAGKQWQAKQRQTDTVYTQPRIPQTGIKRGAIGKGEETMWRGNRIMGNIYDVPRETLNDAVSAGNQSYRDKRFYQDMDEYNRPIGNPFLINRSEVFGTDRRLIPVTGQQKLDSSRMAYRKGTLVNKQDGGETSKDSVFKAFNDSKDFFNEYINSEKYKQRLKIQDYKNPEKTQKLRSDAVKKLKYRIAADGTKIDSDANIDYDPYEADFKGFTPSEAMPHEISHRTNAELTPWFDPFSSTNPNLKLNSKEKKTINSWMTGKTEYYNDSPEEVKSDIDALRYMLNKDGIYDTKSQFFDRKFLEKAREKYKDNFIFKRLSKGLTDSGLMYIMNNVASNNDSQKLSQARYGGTTKETKLKNPYKN